MIIIIPFVTPNADVKWDRREKYRYNHAASAIALLLLLSASVTQFLKNQTVVLSHLYILFSNSPPTSIR